MSDGAIPAWVEEYRNRPFLRAAEGPDAYDCYGVIRAVLRNRFAVEAPPIPNAHLLDRQARLAAALEVPDCPWVPVAGELRAGDVVAFEGAELHVGILVTPLQMLHARLEHGVQLSRIDRPPWCFHRVGPGFRHRDLEVRSAAL